MMEQLGELGSQLDVCFWNVKKRDVERSKSIPWRTQRPEIGIEDGGGEGVKVFLMISISLRYVQKTCEDRRTRFLLQ